MRPWFRVLLLSCFVQSVLVGSLGAEQTKLAGRWVSMKPQDSRLICLYIEEDGSVLRVMPAIQFAAKYRVEGEHVTATMTSGPTGPPKGDKANLKLVINGDTLLDEDGKPLLTRFRRSPVTQDGVRGTWRFIESSRMEQFWTFRSDGQLVMEWALPENITLTGEILRVKGESFVVSQVGETLYVERMGKKEKFIRRPWGCYGVKYDSTAAECR